MKNKKIFNIISLVSILLVFHSFESARAEDIQTNVWSWSSPIINGQFTYKGKLNYIPTEKLDQKAVAFMDACQSKSGEVRVRGFADWQKADFLCSRSNTKGELNIFDQSNPISGCAPYTKNPNRVWSVCGAIVPNNIQDHAAVLVGAGINAGKILRVKPDGSGVLTPLTSMSAPLDTPIP
ncbi:hypothetical protein [Aulosira sp. FACHB-615]|uniref:hypothetical protein n=1 Tax=Aulosira sp. FACHB-615 TaxID=2692777 RepID=UPI001681C3DF|nr:hypothetical protein [Aulosira sp. FACHB-615]MBD2492384.1 hypothetical protein [Aulosira sp. FACHB-615]